MREYPYPYPWRDLPGRPDELAFLEQRFAEMSVLEQYQMEGVGQLESIETAADLINLTAQLNDYDFFLGAVDNETLGHFVAEFEMESAPQQYPFLDFERLGSDYHENHYGAFIGTGYVVPNGDCRDLYHGDNLAQMDHTCIRIKLASKECPEGVWLNFPDEEINNDEPHEFEVTLDALKVPNWSRTIVLETSCCFEKLKNLAEQYDSVEQLITDANNFTYICEEAGQGAYCFTEHLQTAMALENCTELAHALDISQNLHCYDFLPREEHWEKFGHYIARRSGIISEGSALYPYFDYAAYAATEIERLHLGPCDNGYIHRNEKEFRYEYSTPSIEPQGMQMGR